MIRLGHVEITPKIRELVNQVLESGSIGQSDVIHQFEEKFAQWVGTKHAIAVSSGTMADTVALATLKHFNPGKDEVIVPALTFIAQINAIHHNGLKPVFVDNGINMWTWLGYAVDKITKKTLCIFPVHLLGKPTPLPLRHYEGVPVIEDACEAMGSEMMNGGDAFRKCGTFGVMGTFSFFPSHTITTGEGGMIVTDDDDYAEIARRLRNHGKISSKDFHFDVIGFNAKMSSLQAAIGLGMLEGLDEAITERRKSFLAFGGDQDWRLEKICPHAFPVMCDSKEERDATMRRLQDNGIECRNLFSCIPTQEKAYAFLGHKLGEFPQAEAVGDNGLYVPCHQGLQEPEISKIRTVLEQK